MKNKIAIATLALAISIGSISCKKNISDADLQKTSTTIVSSNSAASVEVIDGTAHLSGTFNSEAERDEMIANLKKTEGVKDVMDMTTISKPVVTTSAVDPEMLQKVQDAVKDFPSVTVGIVNGELTLTGDVSSIQARKIKESVDALKLGKVNYNYTVK
ncbi:BON domain-containing protein [Frigoriflavimonas asaccharolytica]|uniref:Hyperosmotically inducible protein n=1 Tax=Frigoriflavimonas asaccharolytica TaxID=2735899 RepID=A0A8J8G9J6_9FLAO|nr:BON domain-containing protein [Frigoriflavimonas asaccharolytica]NRS92024.1 hyperosmotically inducible protein [Frigoriflavimonas asaccharolytica]